MLIVTPNTPDKTKAVQKLMADIEDKCQGKFFCFYQNQSGDEEIDRKTVVTVRSALKEMKPVEHLTVLVDSPGGDADAAFHLVRALRRYTTNLEVVVTDWAKSAATLVALGADKILMGKDAELGPLDAQLRAPSGSAIPLSALNAFKSLEYLQRYALDTLNLAIILMLSKAKMDIPYAIQQALPFVSCIATPLYQQVEPRELGEARRYLSVAEEYGDRIMSRYGYSGVPKQRIKDIVNRLVWQYPSHSFVIDFVEAKELRLNVEELDDARCDLCDELLAVVKGCTGFITTKAKPAQPTPAPPKAVAPRRASRNKPDDKTQKGR